jgi:hypothetical protein
MPPSDPLPLHDFPDRAIRHLLQDPCNLRELLTVIVPDLAAALDFDRMALQDRSFLLEDWRRRESDLLFRIPFREAPDREALICLLLEHQSRPDPPMPLRSLLYAVRYWNREWKQWAESHPHGEPLRLTPVLPIVFHTGTERWHTHRTFKELVSGPAAVRAFAPEWAPIFWDLAERSPEALLNSAGEWLNALAVVRAEREDPEHFRRVLVDALQKLATISNEQRTRWDELLRFILSWALRRRPGGRVRSSMTQSFKVSVGNAAIERSKP